LSGPPRRGGTLSSWKGSARARQRDDKPYRGWPATPQDFQASFKGVRRAIGEKARERGAPVVYVNPRNTSRLCPVHGAKMVYDNGSRLGKCGIGGLWHRDVVACWNLPFKALRAMGAALQASRGQPLDGSPVPLGSTATHDPTLIAREVWARWKSLEEVSIQRCRSLSDRALL